MSTTYTPINEPKQDRGLLVAAITACVVAIVAICAVAGFAIGRHYTASAAPAPAHTTGTVTPSNPVTPTTPVTPAKPVTPAPSAAVMTLQKQLAQLNYYDGSIDGIMGPQTIAAITYLQRDAGLPQTGTMNAATQAALANFLANGNNQMGGNVNPAS
jgi:peptidoglycan hydrolase-like protein with peptidoglycan-binding domain